MSVETEAFTAGGTIPETYTADGVDRSPPLTVGSVPADSETLALIVEDVDARHFVHWLLWNVPADRHDIPAGIPNAPTVGKLSGARQGTNGFGTIGYRGPAPPADDPPHTYRFTLSALDVSLDVPTGAHRSTLADGMTDHILGSAQLTATYDR